MRLFVAIELSDALREIGRATSVALRDRLGSLITARWIPPENLHITVRFIGHVADDRVADVVRALSAPIPIQPFDIRFGRCGVFPASGPPRVIWVGLADGLTSCATLHDELDRRLSNLGFPPEARAFSAHLTIARVKDVRRGAASDVRRAVASLEPDGESCRVAHATLFQSRVSPAGARYDAVARIELVA
jgi:RNA 2',3'-cyclic 3'-phosphodiesterase